MDWKSPNIVRSQIFERWLANELNEPTLNNRVQCEPEELDAETENEILRAEVTSLHGIIDGKDDQIHRLIGGQADARVVRLECMVFVESAALILAGIWAVTHAWRHFIGEYVIGVVR